MFKGNLGRVAGGGSLDNRSSSRMSEHQEGDDETQGLSGDETQSGYRPRSRAGHMDQPRPTGDYRVTKYDSSGRMYLYISDCG